MCIKMRAKKFWVNSKAVNFLWRGKIHFWTYWKENRELWIALFLYRSAVSTRCRLNKQLHLALPLCWEDEGPIYHRHFTATLFVCLSRGVSDDKNHNKKKNRHHHNNEGQKISHHPVRQSQQQRPSQHNIRGGRTNDYSDDEMPQDYLEEMSWLWDEDINDPPGPDEGWPHTEPFHLEETEMMASWQIIDNVVMNIMPKDEDGGRRCGQQEFACYTYYTNCSTWRVRYRYSLLHCCDTFSSHR